MKRYIIAVIALFVLLPQSSSAQRRKSTAKKKTPAKEVKIEDPRIQQMLVSTQQIMFIDSMVVSRTDFMRHIPLSSESGYLEQTDSMGQFTNELKDHRLTAVYQAADSASHLYQSDYIGNRWTAPVMVDGISSAPANFPFMMADGTTLYFAQKGEKSIGGYDIFVTRYDSDSGSFLKAENIGMPFSSTANDYLYAIDEANNLGYFVTDRHQPADKVCIYVFVPNETRRIYDSEAYSDKQLRALADISRIAETWQNKSERQQALQRYQQAKKLHAQTIQRASGQNQKGSALESLRHQVAVLEKALLLARNYYARANDYERKTLRQEILTSERELETLQLEIRKEEKKQNAVLYKDNN